MAKGQVEVAAKGRYAEAKEVRGNVVAEGCGVSEEANRLRMLPFSLTKYSEAFFSEDKAYFGIHVDVCNNKLLMARS